MPFYVALETQLSDEDMENLREEQCEWVKRRGSDCERVSIDI